DARAGGRDLPAAERLGRDAVVPAFRARHAGTPHRGGRILRPACRDPRHRGERRARRPHRLRGAARTPRTARSRGLPRARRDPGRHRPFRR
ncbi:hypothetical protein DMH15_43080, partial [Streptomyces sp. WAC 06725]